MKILFVHDQAQEKGGAERAVHITMRLLEERGHEVRLIGSQGGEEPSTWLSRWLSLRFYLRTAAAIREFKPDVVHAHNTSRIASPSPLLAAKRFHLPVVVTLHDAALLCAKSWGITKNGEPCPGFSLRCLTRCQGDAKGALTLPFFGLRYLKTALHRQVLLRCADHVICPSRGLCGQAARSFHLDPARLTHLPYCLENEAPAPAPREEADPKQFVFVGRMVRVKGLEIALAAVKRLVEHDNLGDVKLLVVGDGPDLQSMQSLTAQLGLSGNVTFVGAVRNQEVPAFYRRSSAVLIPSIWFENSPFVGLEAMNCGRPVIASRVGGLMEQIDHGSSGLLFERGNVLELAQRIKEIYQNPDAGSELGLQAYHKLKQDFGRERHYHALFKVYAGLTQRV
jgi:glycosyltransferase involved in cell wall biosynthesis